MTRIATTRKLTQRKMLRQQNALLPQQESKLQALAHQQRITEAELIRHAVAVFPSQRLPKDTKPLPPAAVAWQEILASFEETRKRSAAGEPQRWTREDYYEFD